MIYIYVRTQEVYSFYGFKNKISLLFLWLYEHKKCLISMVGRTLLIYYFYKSNNTRSEQFILS